LFEHVRFEGGEAPIMLLNLQTEFTVLVIERVDFSHQARFHLRCVGLALRCVDLAVLLHSGEAVVQLLN
jgi:hypothetical protein